MGLADRNILWKASLSGNYLCDSQYLTSEGLRGASLKFKAATGIQRTVHVTPNFALQSEDLALTLFQCTLPAMPTSKWSCAVDEGVFFAIVAKANEHRKPTQVAVFLTEADLPRFSDVKLRFTASEAIQQLAVIDRQLSATGLTGTDPRWTAGG